MSTGALERLRTAWVAANSPEVLERIREETVHLALWQRQRPLALDWLNTLDLEEIGDVQTTLPVADLAGGIPAALAEAGYPEHDGARVLALEIIALAHRFARIMGRSSDADAVRMRLEVVETDACRKFHMDNLKARLLMPLTEPGTQWVEAGAGPDAPIHHLRAGDVGLFKGRIWAEIPAILHRSPPIAATGISRLLLVLDLPSTAQSAPILPGALPP